MLCSKLHDQKVLIYLPFHIRSRWCGPHFIPAMQQDLCIPAMNYYLCSTTSASIAMQYYLAGAVHAASQLCTTT